MSKPYTEADLSIQIDQDLTWRLKEISDLKSVIRQSDAILQKVLLRASVPVYYAHWEGFVRFSARKYLEHIALRKFSFSDLDRQFLRNYFLPRLGALSSSKASVAQRCEVVDDILNAPKIRFSRVNEAIVSTRSNLSFDVFMDICLVCGIDTEQFENKKAFIDIFLLKRRNEIAHGEGTLIEIGDLDRLADETLALMRSFGAALENRVYLGEYKAA